MTNLYKVQATIWIEAESEKAAADDVFDDLSYYAGLDNALRGVAIEHDGELVEEVG